SNGTFVLERDSTGTGNSFYTEGVALDNSFTTTVAFGFYIRQSTASFTQKHYFDNVVIKDMPADNDPPVLIKASTVEGKTIVLNFDEIIEPNDASVTSHYSVSPGNIQPSSVSVSGSLVTLSLPSELNVGN